MKDILFIIPHYLHGGTNKSLQNLLHEVERLGLSPKVYSLKSGGFYESIFKDNIVHGRNLSSYVFRKLGILSVLLRMIDIKLFKGSLKKITLKIEASHLIQYYKPDVVVAFEEGDPTIMGVYFRESKKIAWVQCDYYQHYKRLRYNAEINIEKKVYPQYDKIVCVSRSTQKTMRSYYPDLYEKITFSYNILNVDLVKKRSLIELKETCFDTDCFVLISVGRFDLLKRFDKIPYIVNQIRAKGPIRDFKWYIIAEGEKEKEITLEEIKKYKVEDYVVLLGGMNNPYPFILKSDLLVCLSESESWSYVINEAKILHVPVVTTDFGAAYEVVDKDTGIITSFENVYSVLYDLINDIDGCYAKLKKTADNYSYSNDMAISQLKDVILA